MFRRAFILMVLMVFLVSSAAADISGSYVSGTGDNTTVFYVKAYGNSKVYLSQTKGECAELSATQLIEGLFETADEWGKYHIRIDELNRNTSTFEEWDETFFGGSYTISLNSGTYRITVTPYTSDEINASWTLDKFGWWSTAPQWWVNETKNCSLSYSDPSVPTKATISIYCYDEDGNYIASSTKDIQTKTTIYPPRIDGYTATSSGQSISFNTSSGTASPSVINFYYSRNIDYGTIDIYCYDESYNLLDSQTWTIRSSQGIHPPAISGYEVLSSDGYVSFNKSTHTCSPQSFNFIYKKKGSAPSPSSSHSSNGGGSVTPYSWSTKYQPGTSTQDRITYDHLDYLYDGNSSTTYSYIHWSPESKNGLPDFTAYFNDSSISGIKILNGDGNRYQDYMRINTFYVIVNTSGGSYRESDMQIPDRNNSSYYSLGFSRSYSNVTSIEIYITDRHVGSGDNRYRVHIRDIAFY